VPSYPDKRALIGFSTKLAVLMSITRKTDGTIFAAYQVPKALLIWPALSCFSQTHGRLNQMGAFH
jgi:hypothetical protein